MARSGVVGTAVGLNPAGRPVVKVFVTSRDVRGIPEHLDQVPVLREVTGRFELRVDRTARARPAPIGFSVGHPDITAGTLGARVTNGSQVFILSNNHVLANNNNASIGDPILQPGALDGGSQPGDVIGVLHDYQEIYFGTTPNTMDAAIALVNPADVSGSAPTTEGYGAPGTVPVSASVGMGVQKYGRTTGLSTGTVQETNVTVSVCFETRGPFRCARAATFTDQIAISDGSFSAGGDSGSLIVTSNSARSPVGLLFAGSSTRTVANPIDVILSRFGVTIDPTIPDGTEPPAPTTGALTGTVSSGGGSAIGGATVTVEGTDLSATSSSNGDYTIEGIPEGGHAVTAAAAGYVSDTRSVTVLAGETATQNFTLTADADPEAPSDITLAVIGYKVRGLQKADLSWSGATGSQADVFRNGFRVGVVPNSGSYTDNIDARGGGSYTYRLCEAGTATCSDEVTIIF